MMRTERGQSLVAIFMIIGLVFFGPMLFRWWLGAMQGKGIDVARDECEWNPDKSRYETTLVVYNTERVYKFVLAQARTRFRPPLGKRWPDQTMRQMFGITSKALPIVFEPDGNIEEKLVFTLPEMLEGYTCATTVEVGGQRRYVGRPSIEDVKTAPDLIRKGFLFRLQQRMQSK